MDTQSLSTHLPKRKSGRPRKFNAEKCLEQAILNFREHGYNGTAVATLVQSQGISVGSLYKVFPDKHALFKAALGRYVALRSLILAQLCRDPATGREKLHRTLNFHAESALAAQGRYNCLVSVGLSELTSLDAELGRQLAIALQLNEQHFQDLIKQGQEDGSIAQTVDAAATARLLLALVQGLHILGKAGQRRAAMMAIIEAAMRQMN